MQEAMAGTGNSTRATEKKILRESVAFSRSSTRRKQKEKDSQTQRTELCSMLSVRPFRLRSYAVLVRNSKGARQRESGLRS